MPTIELEKVNYVSWGFYSYNFYTLKLGNNENIFIWLFMYSFVFIPFYISFENAIFTPNIFWVFMSSKINGFLGLSIFFIKAINYRPGF